MDINNLVKTSKASDPVTSDWAPEAHDITPPSAIPHPWGMPPIWNYCKKSGSFSHPPYLHITLNIPSTAPS